MDQRVKTPTRALSRSEQCATLLKEFQLGESLGCGYFGEVITAKKNLDQNNYAIKIVNLKANAEEADQNLREVQILSHLSHPNIVRYFNSWIESAQVPVEEYQKLNSERSLSSTIKTFSDRGYVIRSASENPESNSAETDISDEDSMSIFNSELINVKYLCIQMEFCKNNCLRSAIDNNLYLEEEKLDRYFKEICEGLAYIHGQDIAHRDLKPGNIFLSHDDTIKIGDFGLSKRMKHDEKAEGHFGSLSAPCGTMFYMAPELYDETNQFNTKVDIYSLGVTYFEMASRPMTDSEKATIYPLHEKFGTVEDSTNRKHDLIKNMLHIDGNRRPSCEEIIQSLNSERSVATLPTAVNRRISYPQINYFKKLLKRDYDLQKTNLINFVLKTAVEIFESHGAIDLTMPTFLPLVYGIKGINLTDSNGKNMIILSSSRTAFSNYVANVCVNNCKVTELRRYSTEKVFEKAPFLPEEGRECCFDCISSEEDDFVNDAEILFVVKQICDKIFERDQGVYIFINHGLLYQAILKKYQILGKAAGDLTNLLLHLSEQVVTKGDFLLKLADLTFSKPETKPLISRLWKLYPLSSVETSFKKKTEKEAISKLKTIVKIAETFGVVCKQMVFELMLLKKLSFQDVGRILLMPLLVTEKLCNGFMFQVVKNNSLIALGGRFDSTIKRSYMGSKKSIYPPLSAVGVSFILRNIVQLMLMFSNPNSLNNTITIQCQSKLEAVPIFKRLIHEGYKCNITSPITFDPSIGANQITFNGVTTNLRNFLIIILIETDFVHVYLRNSQSLRVTSHIRFNKIYEGPWTDEKFLMLIKSSKSLLDEINGEFKPIPWRSLSYSSIPDARRAFWDNFLE